MLVKSNDVIPAPYQVRVNSSRNPDVVPAEAGNQHLTYWIPPVSSTGAGSVKSGIE